MSSCMCKSAFMAFILMCMHVCVCPCVCVLVTHVSKSPPEETWFLVYAPQREMFCS